MKQFGTILGFELKSYLKNKIFVGITLAMIVLIIGVMFFPRVRDLIGPLGPDTPDDKPVMLVKAENAAQADLVQQLFAAAFPDHDVRITSSATDAIREEILREDAKRWRQPEPSCSKASEAKLRMSSSTARKTALHRY